MTPAERARIASDQESQRAFGEVLTPSRQQARNISSLIDEGEKLVTVPCSDMTYYEVNNLRIRVQIELRKIGKKLNTSIDPIPTIHAKSREKQNFNIFFSTEKLSRRRASKE